MFAYITLLQKFLYENRSVTYHPQVNMCVVVPNAGDSSYRYVGGSCR